MREGRRRPPLNLVGETFWIPSRRLLLKIEEKGRKGEKRWIWRRKMRKGGRGNIGQGHNFVTSWLLRFPGWPRIIMGLLRALGTPVHSAFYVRVYFLSKTKDIRTLGKWTDSGKLFLKKGLFRNEWIEWMTRTIRLILWTGTHIVPFFAQKEERGEYFAILFFLSVTIGHTRAVKIFARFFRAGSLKIHSPFAGEPRRCHRIHSFHNITSGATFLVV